MYSLYEKHAEGNENHYIFKKPVSLFGCKSGYIPLLLSKKLKENDSEPHRWHVNTEESLRQIGMGRGALLINLKPNSAKPNLSLYEIIDVWGCSEFGWTPVMLYLRGLFVDESPDGFDDSDFTHTQRKEHDPIFSLTYLSGTVRDGRLEGRWTAPGPSSTNSVLLWPKTFEYFVEIAEEIIEKTKVGKA